MSARSGESAAFSSVRHLALLGWAASLHEIGMSIAHSSYHKHSAYIATHADMPGFLKTDQARLATLLLGQQLPAVERVVLGQGDGELIQRLELVP